MNFPESPLMRLAERRARATDLLHLEKRSDKEIVHILRHEPCDKHHPRYSRHSANPPNSRVRAVERVPSAAVENTDPGLYPPQHEDSGHGINKHRG